jgi:hypothetical protein
MWKADLDTVDEAISDGFEENEWFVVLRVEDDLLEFALGNRLAYACHVMLEYECTLIALKSSILRILGLLSIKVLTQVCRGVSI